MRHPRSKKGVIEAQFNWIFILIVGAVILLFFVSMVNKQKTASDMTLSVDLINNLDSIVVGGTLSIGTVYDIAIPPKYILEHKCNNQEKLLTFYESGIEGINLNYDVLFAPNILSGTALSTYSLYWQEPFIVTPFFYMSSDKVLFFIINDSDTSYEEEIDFIYKELPINDDPKRVDKDENKIPISKFKYDKEFVRSILLGKNTYYTNIKIIFFGDLDSDMLDVFEDPGIPESDATISIYQIDEPGLISSEFDQYFEVKYYEIKEGAFDSTPKIAHVLGIPSFFGLLFSENTEDYECNMQKAIFKYDILLEIYHNKTARLKQNVEDNINQHSSNCPGYYSPETYEDMMSEVDNYMVGAIDMGVLFDNIDVYIMQLRSDNVGLGDSSCPIPY